MQLLRKIDHFLHPGIGEVWMLHRVVREKSAIARYHRWEVTPEYLESHIQQYIANGYQFVSMNEVLTTRKKFVAVTLDDGHLDNFTTALPIFEKYQIPFCVYITTGYVEGMVEARKEEHIPMMTKEQVVVLSQHPLCTIGSHTMTHPHLSCLTIEEQRREILGAKLLLEEWTGKPVMHFASPYGDYNQVTLDIVRESDISHVDIWGGPVRCNTHPYLIPRVEIIEKS